MINGRNVTLRIPQHVFLFWCESWTACLYLKTFSCECFPRQDAGPASAPTILAAMAQSELWEHAKMESVIQYLLANKHLQVPNKFTDDVLLGGLKAPANWVHWGVPKGNRMAVVRQTSQRKAIITYSIEKRNIFIAPPKVCDFFFPTSWGRYQAFSGTSGSDRWS